MNELKKVQWDVIITSVICIMLGAVLIFFPTAVNEMIAYFIAGGMFLLSIIEFYNYFKKDIKTQFYRNNLVSAVVALVIGIILLAKKDLVISIIPMILGAIITISGFKKLQNGLDLIRLKLGGWKPVLILSAVNIIFGVIMIICARETADVIIILIGVGLIFSGITDLFSAIWVSKTAKKFSDNDDDNSTNLTV